MKNRPPLALVPTPDAVGRSRRWITECLERIGREDLVESAQLGVSELVTNAILHADSELTVQLRGTHTHPRIEVRDSSVESPVPGELSPDDEDLLMATFGRGLALVAAHSAAWGSHVDPDREGKLVWFEPVPEPHTDPVPVDLFDLDDLMGEQQAPKDKIEIQLLGLPVSDFRELRNYFADLRRELRLLALAHPTQYPLAVEMSDVSLQVERERRASLGTDRLEDAIARRLASVDLDYQVPSTAGDTMARLRDLLDQVPDVFTGQELLALELSARLKQLQAWYLGEFIDQAAGKPPTPWPDGYGSDSHGFAS